MLELTNEIVKARIEKLHKHLIAQDSSWDIAVIVGKVNQYYFTGTMQDGIFILRRDGSYAHFVRKSYLRAQDECLIDGLFPMRSYRDAAEFVGTAPVVYVDKEVATITVMERLQKAFGSNEFLALDRILQQIRAVKDDYEIANVRQAGSIHAKVLNEVVPTLLREGMDEAELTASLYKEMVALGHQGLARFHMFQTDTVFGQIGFGENSIYPTSFDGPGGMKGLSAATACIGDKTRKLTPGDLVFVDIACGFNGYHSDRTQVYRYKCEPDERMVEAHAACLQIQKDAAAMLKPGTLASAPYDEVVGKLNDAFKADFMGVGAERVKFLGHGVGLYVDEYPVITSGFDVPLENNMVIALEPKKSLAGVGIVGVEDTYIVTDNGGECITGGEKEIITVW